MHLNVNILLFTQKFDKIPLKTENDERHNFDYALQECKIVLRLFYCTNAFFSFNQNSKIHQYDKYNEEKNGDCTKLKVNDMTRTSESIINTIKPIFYVV